MKSRTLTIAVTAGLLAAGTGVAAADPGAPGSTFPEQPGTHPATACAAVGSNPGTGPGGAFESASPGALAILAGLYGDVCLEG